MMRRQMKTRIALATMAGAAILALGACGKDKSSQQKEAAGGELLPRSVTDDMLPYDTVRSQPPLENPDAAASAGAMSAHPSAGSTDAADAAEEAAVEATAAEAAPAAKPAGE
jgi:hypothetical protein